MAETERQPRSLTRCAADPTNQAVILEPDAAATPATVVLLGVDGHDEQHAVRALGRDAQPSGGAPGVAPHSPRAPFRSWARSSAVASNARSQRPRQPGRKIVISSVTRLVAVHCRL